MIKCPHCDINYINERQEFCGDCLNSARYRGLLYLNTALLAQVGLLEETEKLYYDIIDIERDSIASCFLLNPVLARPALKKRLNDYLDKYSLMFSISKLHVNDKMEIFSVFENSFHKQNFSVIEFDIFLTRLELLINKILIHRGALKEQQLELNDFGICTNIGKNISATMSNLNEGIDFFVRKDMDYMSIEHTSVIYIFKSFSNLVCNRQRHTTIPVLISIKSSDLKFSHRIPALFCEECNRFFISEIAFGIFEKRYGQLLLRRSFCSVEKGIEVPQTFDRREESELHSWGYNVENGKLTEEERRLILTALLRSGKMTEFSIERDIVNAINMFHGKQNMDKAIVKWKADLIFMKESSIRINAGERVMFLKGAK